MYISQTQKVNSNKRWVLDSVKNNEITTKKTDLIPFMPVAPKT